MTKFRDRRTYEEVEAINFTTLVEYGKAFSDNIVDGIPLSLKYRGYSIFYENDECYLIPKRVLVAKMTVNDMLITDSRGVIFPCSIDKFGVYYEQI